MAKAVHPATHRGLSGAYVEIPLWLALLVGLIPTTFLFHRDRRPSPGYSSCGYNLTGNVSGVCPECGTVKDPAPSRVRQ